MKHKISLVDAKVNMTSTLQFTFRHKGKGTLTGNASITETVFFSPSDNPDFTKSDAVSFFNTVKKAVNKMDRDADGEIEFSLWINDISRDVFRLRRNNGGFLWVNEKCRNAITLPDALNDIAGFIHGVMIGEYI